MENPILHFAEDPDRLEAYVLRRLDADTLARLDEHVRSCDACRQASNEERLIAAGVRRYGREQLRRRLQERLGMPGDGAAEESLREGSQERGAWRVPWPHVLSIAAVLVIIVGVGIQQRWFVRYVEQKNLVTKEQSEPEATGRTAESGTSAPGSTAFRADSIPQERSREADLRDEESRETRSDKVRSQEVGTQTAIAQEAAPEAKESRKARSLEAPPEKSEDRDMSHDNVIQEKGTGPAERSAEGPRSTIAGSSARMKDDVRRAEEKNVALNAARPSMGIVSPESGGMREEFWTGGRLIPGPNRRDEANEIGFTNRVMKRDARAAARAEGEAEALDNVTLDQRPVSRLPETQQRQQLYDPGTIQTLVRQTERETQLTLFPDSPFDSTQLHYARVQQVAPDSIIVQIGDQRIGYRLPASTLRQLQMQLDIGKAKKR